MHFKNVMNSPYYFNKPVTVTLNKKIFLIFSYIFFFFVLRFVYFFVFDHVVINLSINALQKQVEI